MSIIDNFWKWYERHLTVNIAIATVLFSWQVVHLVWLALDVVIPRLIGVSLWHLEGLWQNLILFVDYTEIPALVMTSLVYINQLRKKFDRKSMLYLTFLLSQFFHIFWITDEFVLESFGGSSVVGLPGWLAWIAISIDYLEVPVIIETAGRLVRRLRGSLATI